jgi:hypothetical protein
MKTIVAPWRVFVLLSLTALCFPSRAAVVLTTDTSISDLDLSYDGQDVVVSNCTVTIDGEHAFNSLRLADGGILTHSAGSNGLSLTISNDFQVELGGAINLTGRGFAGNTGTGNGGEMGSSGAGAGHGGYGGLSSDNAPGGNCYGVFDEPVTVGSGGGQGVGGIGGAGGGAIKLVIGGNALLDGGVFANGANATNNRSGGGSGGSIWITTQTVSGSGAITANGGNGEPIHGGGGGGGRIAIMCETNQFTGPMAAFGGLGWKAGGAGTIFTKSGEDNGLLVLDNFGRAGTNSLVAVTNAADITVRGGTGVIPSGGWIAGNVIIESNCRFIVVANHSTLSVAASSFILHTNSLVLADKISVTGIGGGGPYGQGAGHGGYGGISGSGFATDGGGSYGSVNSPTSAGSRGGASSAMGGNGGGVIRLNISGAIHLDGIVSASGGSGTASSASAYYGGGSGGSIWLSAGSFSGTGLVRVNGGDGLLPYGGGGAGGRIAVTFNTNAFSGLITAYGGRGFQYGGAGTIYLKTNQATHALLLIDNGHHVGAITPYSSIVAIDQTVSGGAISGFLGFGMRNILVKSNSVLIAVTPSQNQYLVPSLNNVTIDEGGVLSLDGKGFLGGQGFQGGAGVSPIGTATPRGGGGHGAYGAMNSVGYGNSYGLITDPSQPGSGGGIANGGSSATGGAGGGSLRLSFSGTERVLTVNGRLTADGISPSVNGGGGGAGGSLTLSPSVLTGNGVISVNGGAGTGSAGGGAGGRIAITYNSNLFTGQITAFGGTGAGAGGAGTIYLKDNLAPQGQIIIDNGGVVGTYTPIVLSSSSSARYNLRVTGAATVLAPTALYLSNLTITANGVLSASPTNLLVDVLQNATIGVGGAIKVDGKGYGYNQGPGKGATLSGRGAGAGYGGAGGNSQSGALGGTNYGLVTRPEERGSGGGFGSFDYFGGSEGGGAVQLIVGGTLNLDGALSANGNPGWQDNSGGGSGGSIWISAGALTGAGNISAAGGDGDLFGGGGGGGGRIAIYSPENTFTGGISVSGGFGANSGEAGSIYLATNLFTHLISGTITNLQGDPQSDVNIEPDGLASVTTDNNGYYELSVPRGWAGVVTPSAGEDVVVPSKRSYGGVHADHCARKLSRRPRRDPNAGFQSVRHKSGSELERDSRRKLPGVLVHESEQLGAAGRLDAGNERGDGIADPGQRPAAKIHPRAGDLLSLYLTADDADGADGKISFITALSACSLGQFFDAAQIQFAGAEQRERFHPHEGIGLGLPQIRQVAGREFFQTGGERISGEFVQHHEAFAFLFISDAGDDKGLFRGGDQFVQFFLHLEMRHHFAANFAEATQAVGDLNETILVQRGDVAGGVPAGLQHGGGLFGFAEIAEHHIRAAHEQQPGLAERSGRFGFRVHDAHTNARQRMTDFAALGPDLPETGSAKIVRVHRHGGRTFRAAVGFKRANAELIFECGSESVGKFFRADRDEAQSCRIVPANNRADKSAETWAWPAES